MCVEKALYYSNLDAKRVKEAIDLAEDQQAIRTLLPKMGLVAFVANSSILPRESGISSWPMKGEKKFVSPKSLEVTMELPHKGSITGMGIRNGITLIVGGGYHGKSTILTALELGVYNHIAGDGREYVIADDTAVNFVPRMDVLSKMSTFPCLSMICQAERIPMIFPRWMPAEVPHRLPLSALSVFLWKLYINDKSTYREEETNQSHDVVPRVCGYGEKVRRYGKPHITPRIE